MQHTGYFFLMHLKDQFCIAYNFQVNGSFSKSLITSIMKLETANCMSQESKKFKKRITPCNSREHVHLLKYYHGGISGCTLYLSAQWDIGLHSQWVEISLKTQGVVNENSGGGQILTVYQGKAEIFLEIKSISKVQCHILILFSIFVIKKELFSSAMFTCDFPKTKTKEHTNKKGKRK